ncbi:MAG TPA: response regulator [Candidatus Limnocylindrales bacterium]
MLEGLGYRVLAASNGTEALSQAISYERPIELLVSDVIIPGMNGRELAGQITAIRPGTRVLYASGYTEDAITPRGLIDPEAPFLSKPFSPDVLARKVRAVLDG